MKRLELSRKLARAMEALDKAEAARAAANREVDQCFRVWAAGRCTNRDKARQQLAAVGILKGPTQ